MDLSSKHWPRGKSQQTRLMTWLLYGLALSGLTASGAASPEKSAVTPLGKAGLVTRTFTPTVKRNWRGNPEHTLHVTLWYPAASNVVEAAQFVGPPEQPLFEAGRAAPHAPFAPSLEPMPLILLSHGTGGSAMQLAWLGTALARAGFISAAVDHPGNSADTAITPEGFALWWERATDLSEVLDGLLADGEIGPHVDKNRIGAAGFSLGGYTVMELAGARTDVSALYDLCRTEPANAACRVPEMKGISSTAAMLEAVRKTSGESLARAAESYRDPRVKAVFALAPALGFTLTQESLRSLRLPVEIVVGSADPIAPAANNANLIKASVRGARETVLPGAAHYTFLDTCTSAGTTALAMYCTDPAGIDRNTLHEQVETLAGQFFTRALRGR